MRTVSDVGPNAVSEIDSHATALAALQGTLCDEIMERFATTLLSETRPDAVTPLPHTLWQDSLALLLRIVGSVCPASHLTHLLRAIQRLHLLPRASQLAELHSCIVQTMAALAVTLHLALQPSINPPAMHSIAAVCAQPLAALASRVSFADISSCQVGKPKRLPGTVGASIAFIALDAEGWAKTPLRPAGDESKNERNIAMCSHFMLAGPIICLLLTLWCAVSSRFVTLVMGTEHVFPVEQGCLVHAPSDTVGAPTHLCRRTYGALR
jgi:hypothetical protein